MEIKTIIVDDEPLARDVIRSMLIDFPNIKVIEECSNGKEAIEVINNMKPDLLFLDVQMPDIDGFGVLKALTLNALPVIVFTTAYQEYALSAFNINAIDYLLKPFDSERFGVALKRAMKYHELTQQDILSRRISNLLNDYESLKSANKPSYLKKITVKLSQKIKFIETEKISWIGASGDYICVYTNLGKFLINDSMNNMEKKLDPQEFFRIHRSTIVNINYIKEIEPYFNGEFYLFLNDGTKLKTSRSYKSQIKRLLK